MTTQLPATGERYLPDLMPGEIALEHLHRYYAAAALAGDLDVLDVASGEGYGSALLAGVARSVIGVDIDAAAVEFATAKYKSQAPSLRFAVGSCAALPLADASVDLVVSFETIEHHDQHREMLSEIKRVLRPGGVLVISSPDRHEYSDIQNYRNPHHVKELYREEFSALLTQSFRAHRLYGQRVRHASVMFEVDGGADSVKPVANYLADAASGALVQSAGSIEPRYFVAVATDALAVPELAVGTFAERREEKRIEHLGSQLETAQLQMEAAQAIARSTSEDAKRLRSEVAEWRKHASNLEARIEGQENALRQLAEDHAMQLKGAFEQGLRAPALSGAATPLEAEVASLRAALANREAQLQSIVRSLSWRVTRPLRVGRRIVAMLKARQLRAGNANGGSIVSSDFNEAYYLRRYGDVAHSGMDPYQHFVMFGRPEGRSGCPPKLVLREMRHARFAESTKRGTVLVVSHEATRTGAPILAWNICRELRENFNVVVLLLGKGPLVNAFDEVCDAVAGPYSPGDRSVLALTPVITELCERFPFEFAIVNSIASRAALQPLAERYVPSILLVHEFFKFHCSPDELVDTFAWAGQVVFSAGIVRDSADIERTHPAILRAHVLPQGKSVIPLDDKQSAVRGRVSDPASRIETLQRKILGARDKKPFIVLGAGTVEYRKGVDLFVATASEIRRLAPEADILMVWVGAVVEGHKQYADFIETQVQQLNLTERVEFIDETPDLEALYHFSDLCFISSRLDPLPNIALDGMAAGLPVISFEGATGVAENFAGVPQLAQCVVPYANIEEAARRIIVLYNAPEERTALVRQMLKLAVERFDMSQYVGKLASLSQSTKEELKQVQTDVQTLKAGKEFAEWFYLPTDSRVSRFDAILEFVKSAQGGIYTRKPTPGFYPHQYALDNDLGSKQVNALVSFIDGGRPCGAWQEKLLDVSAERPVSTNSVKIAVHIHAFYPDLLVDIVRRLASNNIKADLFISVPTEVIAAESRQLLTKYTAGSQKIRVVPNRGRDIGPFLTEFGEDLSQYDVVGHFHTKKSVHVDPNSKLVFNWVNYLMETLLGGTHRSAERIISTFADEPQLGLVFADDPHFIGWDKNLPFGRHLADALGLPNMPSQFFSFPVGTMFWARTAALKPLFDLGLNWDDYPTEPLPIDGSMLHALERLLPSIAQHSGFERRVTFAPSVTR